jgi:hypothetical protein
LATLTALVTEDPDPASRSGPLWPVISGLLRRDPARRLGPAEAGLMLRRIAEAEDVPETTAPLASADSAIAGAASPAGRLEHAERTTAFHPYIRQPTAPLHWAEAVAPPHSATGEDVTPTPPTGLPAITAVAPTSGHPAPRVSPADDATPRPGSAEPGTGIAELGAGSQESQPERTEGSRPELVAGSPPTQHDAPAAAGAACVIAAPAAAAAILGYLIYRLTLWLASRLPPATDTIYAVPTAG